MPSDDLFDGTPLWVDGIIARAVPLPDGGERLEVFSGGSWAPNGGRLSWGALMKDGRPATAAELAAAGVPGA